MTTVDIVRDRLIDKLLTISSEEDLLAFESFVDTSIADSGVVTLTEEQMLFLKRSEEDAAAGRVISQEELDKKDLEWLKGK
jgi:predicted transcriptional regulator